MKIARREFIATGSASLASLVLARNVHGGDAKLPLAFSTLGCPGWEWPKILEFAQSNGFAAIELRGLKGNMDLPSLPEFAPDKIPQRKQELATYTVKLACVSSSTELHTKDPAARAKTLGDAKRFIDLASAMGAPYVRVFGNKIEGPRDEVIARVVAGLQELGAYAGTRNVIVILESHGDFVDSPTLKQVLTRADSQNVGLLWDAHHTFVGGHEQPEHTVQELGMWIRHTHLKDSVPDGKDRKYVPTGTGDVPVERQVHALRRIGYKGYFCFEWEKVWHPDIQEPEMAFPQYVKVVSGYLQEPLTSA
jgi:sugar phosphate isomerase/epimerase